jgi:triosephosphate isomerase
MPRGTLIINFKNYPEILGGRSLELAKSAEAVARKIDSEIIVAPPAPMLHAVSSKLRIPVFSQKVDDRDQGKSTGAIVAEAIKRSGCSGSILNHSESRVPVPAVQRILPKMKSLRLSTCLCAETGDEMNEFAKLSAEYLAVEPPELIGTGVAVSRAMPEMISKTVSEVKARGYRGKILFGAGIVSGEDVAAARRCGMRGVLVSSSVVKAMDWKEKIRELAQPLE